MTTANMITLGRIALIPVFMYCAISDGAQGNWAALAIFAFASLTDGIDGYIARKYNQITDFGKLVDPLADKLLVISCMVIFVEYGRFPAWACMIVLAREFAVTGLRLIAVENGRVIAAGWSGKVKTFCTMVGLCVMLVLTNWPVLDLVVMIVIVATTLYSGVEYFVQNWDVLGLSKKAQS